MPIFPLPPVRRDETEGAARKTRVRGPGQNFCMRIRAASGIVLNKGDHLPFAVDDHRDGVPGSFSL